MEAKELRIGNYILGEYYNDDDIEQYETCKVLALDSVGCWEHPIWVEGLGDSGTEFYSDFIPIKLTEEWLVKFGFEDCIIYPIGKNKGNLKCNYGNRATWTWGGQPIKDITYVHQLQNAYFSLTGEELTIKDKYK